MECLVGIDEEGVVSLASREFEGLVAVVAERGPGPLVQLAGPGPAEFAHDRLRAVRRAGVDDHPGVYEGENGGEAARHDRCFVLHDHVEADGGQRWTHGWFRRGKGRSSDSQSSDVRRKCYAPAC